MTRTAQLVLTFIAACITALAVTDPIGIPQWVQLLAGILATGFAAVGIPTGASPLDSRRDRATM